MGRAFGRILHALALCAACSVFGLKTKASPTAEGPPDLCVDISNRLALANEPARAHLPSAFLKWLEINRVQENQKYYLFPFEKGVAEEIIIAPQAKCDKGCNAVFLRQDGGRVHRIDILFFGHLIYSFPFNNTDIGSRSLGALSKDGRRIIYIPFPEKEPVFNNRNTSLVKSYLECLRDTARESFPVFR